MDENQKQSAKCSCILVVEDNQDIRDAVEDLLRQEGYRVYGVQNGREALLALKKIPGRPLVLLDMMMPVMSGWDFFEARHKEPNIGQLPIVVMSALGPSAALAHQTKSLPAVGYVTKPIPLEGLLEIVAQHCTRVDDVARPLALAS
jgi:CheY-like chemotaxis protein